MALAPPNPVTELLAAACEGDSDAQGRVWSLIYDELRRIAQRQMGMEAPGRTLQPTALVHEAFLKLVPGDHTKWESRRHFFGAAAKAMHRIRVDDARKRNRLKRGGGNRPEPLADGPAVFDQDPAEILAVDEALEKLKERDPRQAEVVVMRYFAGLNIEETAGLLEVSTRTVKNDWRLARAWLHRELSSGGTRTGSSSTDDG